MIKRFYPRNDKVLNFKFVQNEEDFIVEESLKKIEAGTYGICDMCGVVIPLGRLKAKPFAKYCTECRTVYENETMKRAKN